MPALVVAWEWMKKHAALMWGLLIALVGFLVGVSVRKKPVIISGEDPDKIKIEQQTAIEIQQAESVREVQISEAEKEAASEEAAVIQQEQKATEKVVGDVDQTNDYLQDVSKQFGGRR